ncbi:MAG: hypothetical protein ABS939_02625 [Psychrobacillus sp.]
MGRQPGSLNKDKIKLEDIQTPRTWEELNTETKAFFVEFECFLVLRQLLELNLQPRHILDMVAVGLMKHNRDLLPSFREELIKTNDKYTHSDLFNATLCKYLWSAGVGINKIMKFTHMAQNTVYRIAYYMAAEQEKGYFKSNYMHFMDKKFIENLDAMMNVLRTMDGLAVRRERQPKNTALTQQIDIVRQNLRKRQAWH